MESIDKQLKRAKKVAMTSREHQGLRSLLMRHMLLNPYPIEAKKVGYQMAFAWQLTLIVTFLITTTGGISVAASSSLPGDLLYPVKLHVNEEVKGLIVSTSPEKKIEWRKERVKTRLKEAEALSDKQALTPEKKVAIEKTLKTQIEDFTATTETETKKAAVANEKVPETALSASLELEASLKEHQDKLVATEQLADPKAEDSTLVKTMEESVQKLNEKTDQIILENIEHLDKDIENAAPSVPAATSSKAVPTPAVKKK